MAAQLLFIGTYLRGLRPDLPRPLWVLSFGVFISTFGNGLMFPFVGIYLHFVRGFPIPLVGLIISLSSAGVLVMNLGGGALIDRFGARRLALSGLALQAVGYGMFAAVVNLPLAVTAAIIAGCGNGLFYPAFSTALANLATSAERSSASSLQYALTNLGIGSGAIVGGIVASVQHAFTFTVLILAGASTFVVYGVFVAIAVSEGPPATAPAPGSAQALAGYRRVFKDPLFLSLVALNAAIVTAGYAQLDSNVPLYAKVYLGVSPRSIGLLLAANTAFIVIAQLPLSSAVRHRSRITALTLFAACWVTAWLLGWLASLTAGAVAVTLLAGFMVVFAAGECFLSGTLQPMAMDLSPAAYRGTYMSVLSLSWGIGLLLGPVAGSALVASRFHTVYWLVLAVCSGGLLLWIRLFGQSVPADRVYARPEAEG